MVVIIQLIGCCTSRRHETEGEKLKHKRAGMLYNSNKLSFVQTDGYFLFLSVFTC